MTFDKNLRELRLSANLTQKQLAEALGIAFSTVSMYERGKREPDISTLIAIANYFNVSLDTLVGHSAVEIDTVKTTIKNPINYDDKILKFFKKLPDGLKKEFLNIYDIIS